MKAAESTYMQLMINLLFASIHRADAQVIQDGLWIWLRRSRIVIGDGLIGVNSAARCPYPTLLRRLHKVRHGDLGQPRLFPPA